MKVKFLSHGVKGLQNALAIWPCKWGLLQSPHRHSGLQTWVVAPAPQMAAGMQQGLTDVGRVNEAGHQHARLPHSLWQSMLSGMDEFLEEYRKPFREYYIKNDPTFSR